MKKTLKWISPVFVFGFMMLFSSNLQAQLSKNTDNKMEMAKDRYEQQHNLTVADSDFKQTIAPTQNNLQMWEEVLAGFSLQEKRGTPSVGLTNGAGSNNPKTQRPVMTLNGVQNVGSSEYQAVKSIVRTMRKSLGLPVGLQ